MVSYSMGVNRPSESCRRRVLDLVGAGRRVSDAASDLGITEQTIYNWRRQDGSTLGSSRI